MFQYAVATFLFALARAQMNNPCCQMAPAQQEASGCVCVPAEQAQLGAAVQQQRDAAAAAASAIPSSNPQPGYLPDYRGDNYTNPEKIAETQALNAAFFQSIGGEPQYQGGVAAKDMAAQCDPCSPEFQRLQAPPPYDEAKSTMYPNPNTPYPPPPHGAATHSNVGYAPQYQPNLGGPPPHLGGAPTMPPTTQTTYVYVADHSFGPKSIHMTCPHCHQQVVTKVKYNAGLLTWLLVGGCLLFGCWLGCCLIPFCIEDCQDVEHFCPNCNSYLGQYKRI